MTAKASPIGTTVADHMTEMGTRSARYRAARDRLRPFEQLARAVIMRRAELGLSQQELARRMGTTKSVVSRLESGQHRVSTETLRRVAQALGGHAVIGFDFGTTGHPHQELVTL